MKNLNGKLAFLISAALVGVIFVGTDVKADTEKDSLAIPDGVVLNYHEMEAWDTSFSDEEMAEVPRVYGTLPESYSSSAKISDSIDVAVEQDYVTAVKYQSGGSCWAHVATSIAETSYIKNKGITDTICSDLIDFSEYHLVHYTYHSPADPLGLFGGDQTENTSGNTDLDVGGNLEMALCNYANWIGVSDSTEITASDVGTSQSDELAFADAAHLENGYILSMPKGTSGTFENDMIILKQMIMDYGSVSVSYYSGGSNYYANGYQYCDIDMKTNHAVTIVGWNDSIPASSFPTMPAGDGAWLVKNSWGEAWGLNGYFWLSYYDASVGDNAIVMDFTNNDNYDNNYQYDGTGNVWETTRGYYNQVTAANAFVADSPESLEAVGFYTYSNDMDYEIRIYRRLGKDALPQTGDLVWTQDGNEIYAGFHTVDLTKSIPVREGERYAIVITWRKEGSAVYARADRTRSYDWINFTSYAKSGESYWGYGVESLKDLNAENTEHADGVNVRIKSFTNEIDVVNTTGISLSRTSATLTSGSSLQLSVATMPENATYQGVTYSSADPSIATVDKNGLIIANTTGKAGSTTITALSEDSNRTAFCSITVQPIFVTKITLNRTAVSLKPGENSTIAITTVAPANATEKGVIWSSSNTNVATVDQNGQVRAISEGSATITATAKDGNGARITCVVSVEHDWNSSYTMDKEPTCTVQGSRSIHCKNCGAKKDSQAIAATGHAPVVDAAVAATYTSSGKTQGSHCAKCGTILTAQNTIPALKGLTKTNKGVRYYYENGKVKTSLTTLIKDNGSWYYVQKGVVSGKYTGLCNYNGSWYYVKNSKVDFSYTGLCKHNGSWYYVKNGVLNWKYTGLCKHNGSWYYVKNGVLNWKYTGLCKHNGSWYYVKNGVLNWKYTGLCKHNGSWYYVKNGVLNWKYTGLCKHNGKWYYVQKGVLNWNYTGYTNYGGARWYVKKGIMVRKA